MLKSILSCDLNPFLQILYIIKIIIFTTKAKNLIWYRLPDQVKEMIDEKEDENDKNQENKYSKYAYKPIEVRKSKDFKST